MAFRKCNVSLEADLVDRIDAYAEGHRISRSAVIAIACNDFLAAVAQLPELRSQLVDFQNQLADLARAVDGQMELPDLKRP